MKENERAKEGKRDEKERRDEKTFLKHPIFYCCNLLAAFSRSFNLSSQREKPKEEAAPLRRKRRKKTKKRKKRRERRKG